MLKIGTIGIGNAGNQVAELAFVERQIPGIAINSSQKDLCNVKSITKLIIGDEKGAGKNRDDAKKFIKEQISNLLEVESFKSLIEGLDVIFVISSIAGGTGSGMAPIMTDILSRKYNDRTFVLVEIYPPLKESVAAQQNAIDYLKEVQNGMPNAVYMCYDNNRKSEQLPSSLMMQEVNKEIVEHLEIIRGDDLYPTPFTSIDEKDMLKILETPGRLAVYSVSGIKEKDLDNKSFEDFIIEEIKTKSANVELDRDKIVKRMGVISNLNENLNTMFNTNVQKVKDLVGEPVEGFEHIFIGDKDTDNKISVILSGLSVPNDRLEKISQRIEEGLIELSVKKKESILDNFETTDVKSLRDNGMKNSSKFDMDEIFNKY